MWLRATHSGTHEMPAGSKDLCLSDVRQFEEHRKNLQNYPPNHPWPGCVSFIFRALFRYIENVTRARLQYHPDSQPEGFLRSLDLLRILPKLELRNGREEIQGATWIFPKSLNMMSWFIGLELFDS